MKKLILFTFLIIGNHLFSQENQQEIVREQQRLEDLANNQYYENGGKLLFYDIYDQQKRWYLGENLSVSELNNKIADLEKVRKKWEASNGPLAIALSRIDKFHNYNNKICSTYGAVKTPNSDHIMDWCKIRDDYKRQYPRESSAYKQAMGYWQRNYDYANQLLRKKKSSQNNNKSSDNNYNSNNNTSNSSSDNTNNSDNSSRNTNTNNNNETYAQKQQRERDEHAKKLAKERKEWADKQEAKRIATNNAAEALAPAIVAVADMINIREPDFDSNKWFLSYSLNEFNETNFGFSHKSGWGIFFWQIDFLLNGIYFNGWRLDRESKNDLTSYIDDGDLYWPNYSEEERLYKSEKIISIGGGMNTGFGFAIPINNGNQIILNSLIEGRISKIISSYGFKFGLEYELDGIGFGVYYTKGTYNLNEFADEPNDIIFPGEEELKFKEIEAVRTDWIDFDAPLKETDIKYYRPDGFKRDDINNLNKISYISFSIFFLI